jgi:hypothetical protein
MTHRVAVSKVTAVRQSVQFTQSVTEGEISVTDPLSLHKRLRPLTLRKPTPVRPILCDRRHFFTYGSD